MKSLLKPAISAVDEGLTAAKKTAAEVADTARELFRSLVPDKPSISEEALSIHNAVESGVSQGLSKKEVYDEIGQVTGLTNTEINANEKIFSRLSGGGASDNIIDEVRLVTRALTTKPTGLQQAASEIAGGKGTKSTRIAREKAGKAAIGAGVLGYGLGEIDFKDLYQDLVGEAPTKKEASAFEKAFSKAHNAGKETFIFQGGEYSTEVKKGKSKGGSLLTRDNYEEGSEVKELSNAEQIILLQDKGKAALDNAETPEERNLISSNLEKVLRNFTDSDIFEAAKLRAELAGQDTNEELSPRYMGGRMNKDEGSLMTAPEREGYSAAGKVVDIGVKAGEGLKKIIDEAAEFINYIGERASTEGLPSDVLAEISERGKKVEKLLTKEFNFEPADFEDIATKHDNVLDYYNDLNEVVHTEASLALMKKESTADLVNLKPSERVSLGRFGDHDRVHKDEGSLLVPPEMEGDMPVDTYPNIPPEEMAEAEASQLPDATMEDQYMDFVLSESLDDEEQSYLMNALETDEKLSQIFDKVITTASEFTGSGEVDGPGTGVSDSIPARLSDGEFVFTKKATDQMGSDNLQAMMDDAERAYDGGEIREPAQEGGLLLYKGKDEDPLAYEKIAQDEIKKNMLRSNRAPSLNPG